MLLTLEELQAELQVVAHELGSARLKSSAFTLSSLTAYSKQAMTFMSVCVACRPARAACLSMLLHVDIRPAHAHQVPRSAHLVADVPLHEDLQSHASVQAPCSAPKLEALHACCWRMSCQLTSPGSRPMTTLACRRCTGVHAHSCQRLHAPAANMANVAAAAAAHRHPRVCAADPQPARRLNVLQAAEVAGVLGDAVHGPFPACGTACACEQYSTSG